MSEGQTSNRKTPSIDSGGAPKIEKEDVRDWYYTIDGVRYGPVSTREIHIFVNKNAFDENTRVWRKGMKEWMSIRDSELGDLISSEPPPLPSQLVANLQVWIIAFLPLVFFSIDASIAWGNITRQGWVVGTPFQPVAEISIFVPATINAMLCLWDAVMLKRAGYKAHLIGACIIGFVLVPAYLYWRARHLHQRQSCVITWIIMTVLGGLIYASVSA